MPSIRNDLTLLEISQPFLNEKREKSHTQLEEKKEASGERRGDNDNPHLLIGSMAEECLLIRISLMLIKLYWIT